MENKDIELGFRSLIQQSDICSFERHLSPEEARFIQILMEKKEFERKALDILEEINFKTKRVLLPFFVGVGILFIFFSYTDKSCVEIKVPRFFMNLAQNFLIQGILMIVSSPLLCFKEGSEYFMFFSFLKIINTTFQIFIFFNIFNQCSYQIYSFLLSLYMIVFITVTWFILLIANKESKRVDTKHYSE
uniref:Uncharacterized protein n=1 Tax=viral metagenome TaxID=1070528 RepID=A0A6C0BBY6_9ZZZZ